MKKLDIAQVRPLIEMAIGAEINGKLVNGDVEIHLDHAAWKQHGHGDDPRYDDVVAEVAAFLDERAAAAIARGRFDVRVEDRRVAGVDAGGVSASGPSGRPAQVA